MSIKTSFQKASGWRFDFTSSNLEPISAEELTGRAQALGEPIMWHRRKFKRPIPAGWYMVQANVTRKRLGHNLCLKTDDDQEFNLLLGAKVVTKRVIHLESKVSSIDVSLSPGHTLEEGLLFSLVHMTSGFARARMINKLAFATGAAQLDSVPAEGDGETVAESGRAIPATGLKRLKTLKLAQLYLRYNRLQERHVKQPNYQQWLREHNASFNANVERIESRSGFDWSRQSGYSAGIVVLDESPDAESLVEGLKSVPLHFRRNCKLVLFSPEAAEAVTAQVPEFDMILEPNYLDTGRMREILESMNKDALIVVGKNVLPGKRLFPAFISAVCDDATRLVYCDHDHFDDDPADCKPVFKPEWNVEMLLGGNYVGPVIGVDLPALLASKGLDPSTGDSLLYSLLLAHVGNTRPEQVTRIAAPLYRVKSALAGTSYDCPSDVVVLQKHLDALKLNADVVSGKGPFRWGLKWRLPATEPAVDILIPTRDRSDLLKTCVDSIVKRTDYQNYKITIIDNDSKEAATKEYFQELSGNDRVQIIEMPGEFNYSRLNNDAAKQTSGDVLLLLNNDTEVFRSDWLEQLVVQAIRPDVGCVGAKLYYSNGLIQHAGVIVGLKGVAGHAHRFYTADDEGFMGRLMLSQNVSAVTAACLAVRRDVFEAVNGLDDVNLKVAYNDVDFCLRVAEAGYKNVWTPYAELFHHESVSRGSDDTRTKAKRFRAEYEYMLKRWKTHLICDPAYNPNLSHDSEDFSLAA